MKNWIWYGSPGGCDCGQPAIDGEEFDMKGYMTPGEAQRGHMKMCQRWAKEKK